MACDTTATSKSTHDASALEASTAEAIVDAGVDAMDAADAPDADVMDLVEHGLSMLEDAGRIIHDNMNDCAAMGERLEEYRTSHADAVDRVQLAYENTGNTERHEVQARFRTRFKAAWANIRPGVMKCRHTPKVNRVLREIWGDDPDAGS